MSTARSGTEKWVPASMETLPASWLSESGPSVDACLSSRVRFMRNMAGRRFPHHASSQELRSVVVDVVEAARKSGAPDGGEWSIYRGLGPAERDALVAERLISPDFATESESRAVLLDAQKRVCVMVNEEDHIRVQALTAGWSVQEAERLAHGAVSSFEERLKFAFSPRFGYLSASPYNCGDGVRISAMFHLIGLAHTKRLPKALKALDVQDVVARGLFGESSRAIGALLQVSVTSSELASIQGAGEYLLAEERAARKMVGKDELKRRVDEAATFGIASRTLSLADALRIVGWVRWAASEGIAGYPSSPRAVDRWLTLLALRTGREETKAARDRAVLVRELIEGAR